MLAADEVFAALAAVLRQLCEDPLPDLTPATPLLGLPLFDSLRLLESVALLEDRFGVEVDTLGLERLDRLEDIVALIGAARPLH